MTYQHHGALTPRGFTSDAQLNRIHRVCPAPDKMPAYTPQEARVLEDHYIKGMMKEGYLVADGGVVTPKRVRNAELEARLLFLMGERPHTGKELAQIVQRTHQQIVSVLNLLEREGKVTRTRRGYGKNGKSIPSLWSTP